MAIEGGECVHAVDISLINVCWCYGLRVLHECDMMPLIYYFSASAQRSVDGAIRLAIVALERSTTPINEKVEAVFVGNRRWPGPKDRGVRLIRQCLDEVLKGCVTEGAVKQEK